MQALQGSTAQASAFRGRDRLRGERSVAVDLGRASPELSCHIRVGRTPPAMAVVIQPLLEAQVSGVAYSVHPLTGRATQVMINAVAGLAATLVDGTATPDQYVVEIAENSQPIRISERTITGQTQALRMTDQGLQTIPLSDEAVGRATLSDDRLFTLARAAKQIEKAFGHPVDLEWLYDERGLWLVQARPISGLADLGN